jgi:hypothetical protein
MSRWRPSIATARRHRLVAFSPFPGRRLPVNPLDSLLTVTCDPQIIAPAMGTAGPHPPASSHRREFRAMKVKVVSLLIATGMALAIVGSVHGAQNPGGAHKDVSGGGPSPSHWSPGQK